jgi:hypothetical protein
MRIVARSMLAAALTVLTACGGEPTDTAQDQEQDLIGDRAWHHETLAGSEGREWLTGSAFVGQGDWPEDGATPCAAVAATPSDDGGATLWQGRLNLGVDVVAEVAEMSTFLFQSHVADAAVAPRGTMTGNGSAWLAYVEPDGGLRLALHDSRQRSYSRWYVWNLGFYGGEAIDAGEEDAATVAVDVATRAGNLYVAAATSHRVLLGRRYNQVAPTAHFVPNTRIAAGVAFETEREIEAVRLALDVYNHAHLAVVVRNGAERQLVLSEAALSHDGVVGPFHAVELARFPADEAPPWIDLAVDDEPRLHASYATPDGLVYRSMVPGAEPEAPEPLTFAQRPGELALDRRMVPHLAYVAEDGSASIAWREGGAWQTQAVTTDGATYDAVTLAFQHAAERPERACMFMANSDGEAPWGVAVR